MVIYWNMLFVFASRLIFGFNLLISCGYAYLKTISKPRLEEDEEEGKENNITYECWVEVMKVKAEMSARDLLLVFIAHLSWGRSTTCLPRPPPSARPPALSSRIILPFCSSSFFWIRNKHRLEACVSFWLSLPWFGTFHSSLSPSCTCAFFVSLQVSLPLLHSSPPAHGPESSFVYFSYPRPPPSSQFWWFWSHQDQRRWDERKEIRKKGR